MLQKQVSSLHPQNDCFLISYWNYDFQEVLALNHGLVKYDDACNHDK